MTAVYAPQWRQMLLVSLPIPKQHKAGIMTGKKLSMIRQHHRATGPINNEQPGQWLSLLAPGC